MHQLHSSLKLEKVKKNPKLFKVNNKKEKVMSVLFLENLMVEKSLCLSGAIFPNFGKFSLTASSDIYF